jgi:hypothetical protein
VLENYFFIWGKTYNGAFLGIFKGGLDLFDPKIVLRYDNLGVKKVSAPLKNPAKCPITCFACEKKIISRTSKISGTVIVILAHSFNSS